jgi:hypothetical protein
MEEINVITSSSKLKLLVSYPAHVLRFVNRPTHLLAPRLFGEGINLVCRLSHDVHTGAVTWYRTFVTTFVVKSSWVRCCFATPG